ncbi:MAG: hypothetical protein N4A61_09685 [Pelagimonas sp.]|jgi:hypothetical protein|nr:hypothetical protein [Pelagimonas sp.]
MVYVLRHFGLRAMLLCSVLVGCTQFPELEEGRIDLPGGAEFPRILPLDPLLADGPRTASVATVGHVEGRVAGLNARADQLRAHRVGSDRALEKRIARLRQKAAALQDM